MLYYVSLQNEAGIHWWKNLEIFQHYVHLIPHKDNPVKIASKLLEQKE